MAGGAPRVRHVAAAFLAFASGAASALNLASGTAGFAARKESLKNSTPSTSPHSTMTARRHVEKLGPCSGLVVCKVGDGKHFARAGDVIQLHYLGKRRDGTVFDSSRSREKEPMAFEVGKAQVSKSLDAAVMKMSLGEKAILQLSAVEAFGSLKAAGAELGADADVRFELELVAINNAKEPAPEQGYEGEDVSHEDWKTCTEDWGVEYGTEWEEGSDKGPCSPDEGPGDAKSSTRGARHSSRRGDEPSRPSPEPTSNPEPEQPQQRSASAPCGKTSIVLLLGASLASFSS